MTLTQLSALKYDDLLKIRNFNRKCADEVMAAVEKFVYTPDGKVALKATYKRKNIAEILDELLVRSKVIVIGDGKDGEVLLLRPCIAGRSSVHLSISQKNYTKLHLALDGKARVFLAASDAGQKLCAKATPSANVVNSLFEAETETDFVKELVYEVMSGEERIEQILVDAMLTGSECKFATTISRLIFGVPSAEVWKRYKPPVSAEDIAENAVNNTAVEISDLKFDDLFGNSDDEFSDIDLADAEIGLNDIFADFLDPKKDE
jgi:hypothetical protein